MHLSPRKFPSHKYPSTQGEGRGRRSEAKTICPPTTRTPPGRSRVPVCIPRRGHGSDRRRRLPPRRPARVVRRERPAAAGLRPRARRRQEGHPLRRARSLHAHLQVCSVLPPLFQSPSLPLPLSRSSRSILVTCGSALAGMGLGFQPRVLGDFRSCCELGLVIL